MNFEHILLTGGAGFIGSHLSEKLLHLGYRVTTIDNFDSFYSKQSKKDNLINSFKYNAFKFFEVDIRDKVGLNLLPDKYDLIIHLAAKAGVLPSIQSPDEYTETNIVGTQNLLEFAKRTKIRNFIFGSSSSVYGVNPEVPWSENLNVLRPISPYAVTKISGELIGQVYSLLFDIRFISLRFFTVYGPRQRPDLAIHRFSRNIYLGKSITIYGDGYTKRDYTYVDDIVDGIVRSLDYQGGNFEIFNIGSANPIALMDLINSIEVIVNKKAIIEFLPEQAGDVRITSASVQKASTLLGYHPKMPLQEGLRMFWKWFAQDK